MGIWIIHLLFRNLWMYWSISVMVIYCYQTVLLVRLILSKLKHSLKVSQFYFPIKDVFKSGKCMRNKSLATTDILWNMFEIYRFKAQKDWNILSNLFWSGRRLFNVPFMIFTKLGLIWHKAKTESIHGGSDPVQMCFTSDDLLQFLFWCWRIILIHYRSKWLTRIVSYTLLDNRRPLQQLISPLIIQTWMIT